MKLSETGQLLTLIALNYKGFEINAPKAQLWYELIGDLPFELAQIALKKVMLTSQFPPTIAEVRKAVAEITAPKTETLDAGESWGEVTKAIKACGFYEPEEAYKLMSPLTKKVVEQLTWREICTCEEPGVIRGQFMKMFNSLMERQKSEKMLPTAFLKQINQIQLKNSEEIKKISEGVNKLKNEK